MKISHTLLMLFCMATFFQTGCKKDALETPPDAVPAQYTLEVRKDMVSGGIVMHKEQAVNLSANNVLNAWLHPDDDGVELRIGNESNTLINATFFASVTFPSAVHPKDIIGEYNFPGDNLKAKLLFTEKINNNNLYLISFEPKSGKLIIEYDRETDSFRGMFENIQFAPPLAADYTNMVLDGSFAFVKMLP